MSSFKEMGVESDVREMVERQDEKEITEKAAYSVVEFLTEEMMKDGTSPDNKKKLEASLKGVEEVFEVTLQDSKYKSVESLREMVAGRRCSTETFVSQPEVTKMDTRSADLDELDSHLNRASSRKVGVDSSPPAPMHPFELFPVEVWEMILNHVEGPLEKLKLVRINPALEKEFGGGFKDWAFPKVISILMKNFEDMNWDEQEPPNLDIRDIFIQCRAFSKRCSREIAKFHEDYWRRHRKCSPYLRHLNVCPLRPVPDKIPSILERMEKYGITRNSLIPRDLVLYNYREMTNELASFLEKIGSHIYYLKVSFINSHPNVEKLNFLRSLIPCTPNLKILDIFMRLRNRDMAFDEPLDLPDLPEMEDMRLKCSAFPNEELSFQLGFRVIFPHLVLLDISFKFWREEFNAVGLFPNIEKLGLFGVNAWEKEGRRKCTNALSRMDVPKLKKILLEGDFMDSSAQIEATKTYFLETPILIFKLRYPTKQATQTFGE